MSEPKTERALLTVAMAPDELRVVKVNARARGLSMSSMIRQLLARELVDLER